VPASPIFRDPVSIRGHQAKAKRSRRVAKIGCFSIEAHGFSFVLRDAHAVVKRAEIGHGIRISEIGGLAQEGHSFGLILDDTVAAFVH
jgi:hypothetical protein